MIYHSTARYAISLDLDTKTGYIRPRAYNKPTINLAWDDSTITFHPNWTTLPKHVLVWIAGQLKAKEKRIVL